MTAVRTALYLATGCLTYLATLLVTLPAPWIARAIERSSRQALVLRNPAGTVWSGSGRLYVHLRSGGLLDLGTLRWNTPFSGIFAGTLGSSLALGDQAKTARLELSLGSTTVRELSVEFPGEIVGSAVPAMEALGPGGRISIRSDNLRIDANSILGLADVEWRPVRLARAQGLDLGSHVAHLRGAGRKIDVELGTVGGPLRLSGGGSWSLEGGLAISGALEHGEDRTGTIAPFLQGICSEYRPGRCVFRFKQ